jgi:hypothetical protein
MMSILQKSSAKKVLPFWYNDKRGLTWRSSRASYPNPASNNIKKGLRSESRLPTCANFRGGGHFLWLYSTLFSPMHFLRFSHTHAKVRQWMIQGFFSSHLPVCSPMRFLHDSFQKGDFSTRPFLFKVSFLGHMLGICSSLAPQNHNTCHFLRYIKWKTMSITPLVFFSFRFFFVGHAL